MKSRVGEILVDVFFPAHGLYPTCQHFWTTCFFPAFRQQVPEARNALVFLLSAERGTCMQENAACFAEQNPGKLGQENNRFLALQI